MNVSIILQVRYRWHLDVRDQFIVLMRINLGINRNLKWKVLQHAWVDRLFKFRNKTKFSYRNILFLAGFLYVCYTFAWHSSYECCNSKWNPNVCVYAGQFRVFQAQKNVVSKGCTVNNIYCIITTKFTTIKTTNIFTFIVCQIISTDKLELKWKNNK